MTRTENEQEFVLGNRQLLSAFFVVVMLLGVFFAMGYIIGHNSSADSASKKSAPGEPVPVPAASTQPDTTSAAGPPPTVAAAPADTNPPRTETRAVMEEKPVVEKPAPEKHVVEKPVEKADSEPTDRGPVRVESTRGHTYLQVSAVKRPAADSIVKTLRDKGFPALLGESSKPELFRVLVGPYAETESLSKAKSDLKAMGFDAVVSK
jgi:cell division protein FtsN